jgi:peptidoglycan/xylan/chitin deacetylase (PgdA/CDA1 family)
MTAAREHPRTRGLAPLAALAALRSVARRRSVALCHHGVGSPSDEQDPFALRVPEERFRTQVELLLAAGFRFVTAAELVARANGGAPPPGLIALTFDDGMADNHSVVLPLLREYGITATVYVITGLVGGDNPWVSSEEGGRMMTAEQLCELAAAGVELGAHTVTHPDMSLLDGEACLREMLDSRDQLEELTGVRARTFAYPFCRYGEAARRAAQEAGFEAAFTCDHRGSWDRFEFRRALLRGRDNLAVFVGKASGTYYPVYESPPTRVLRASTQAVRRRLRERRERRRERS